MYLLNVTSLRFSFQPLPSYSAESKKQNSIIELSRLHYHFDHISIEEGGGGGKLQGKD